MFWLFLKNHTGHSIELTLDGKVVKYVSSPIPSRIAAYDDVEVALDRARDIIHGVRRGQERGKVLGWMTNVEITSDDHGHKATNAEGLSVEVFVRDKPGLKPCELESGKTS